jgi:YfiH family protein
MNVVLHGKPPSYLTYPGLMALGLPHATTTRHCPGIQSGSAAASPFAPSARDALAPAGLDLSRVTWAKQVHGADVARAPAAAGLAGRADVLVTAERGAPVAIFTADCLPLTAYDPEARVLGVAHVGWRGLVRGTVPASVTALTSIGARLDCLGVAIGPAIGPCCYEIDTPVIEQFAAAHASQWQRWVAPARPGHWMLDLWAAAEDLLEHAGIPRERIENPRLCTACHPELLYSYRKGNRGRLVTLAALP